MLHVVFFEPRIPGNTGNAIRMAAGTGATLHLVEPLGFDLSEARLKRAGLDYHDLAHVVVTSVDRDDVSDGGASIFAETIREIRRRTPSASAAVPSATSASPMRSLLAGMMAVCGSGTPSGWRNSAVTANQSASPPTIAASQNARR